MVRTDGMGWPICYDTCRLQGRRIGVEVAFIGNRMEWKVPWPNDVAVHVYCLQTATDRRPTAAVLYQGRQGQAR